MEDISPAEFFLLNCLYELGEGDFSQILERVNRVNRGESKNWKKSTVLTLIKRLIDKGYVQRQKRVGRGFLYKPVLTWMETIEFALRRFFGSSFRSTILAYLLNMKKLTKKEEDLLQQLLSQEKE